MQKKILTPHELIKHMSDRNIKFELITEHDAEKYIQDSNYYKKLSCYKSNYTFYKSNETKIYNQLDFAYLKELSIIDMRLRYLILIMCLDIEHSVRKWIINTCIQNGEDGYQIATEFLAENPGTKKEILSRSNSPYCKGLIRESLTDCPIWILVEVISFGDLCKLYVWMHKKRNYLQVKCPEIIQKVRHLRNASAHNHCIIRDLKRGDANTLPCVSNFLSQIPEISKSQRKSRMSNIFINDFVSTLYFYDMTVSSIGLKKHNYDEICRLFSERMVRNKDYFIDNEVIRSSYLFCKKVVDKIATMT